MKGIVISVVLFTGLVNICSSQGLTGIIRGRVLDLHSNQSIPGANIVLGNSEPVLGAVSDGDGYFHLANVPVGRQSLHISFVGYTEKTIPEVMVTTGRTLFLEIELQESLMQMEEIVVRADDEKGTPLNEMSTVSSVSFSVEETGRYAATFNDPARAALSFAGVRGGGDDLLNEIVIRGNSPRGMLWRVEGVEVPNPNHFAEVGTSGGGISMLSVNMLGNSDFLTGAFPAEYGNATSGVFDINLRKGNSFEGEYAFQAGLLGIEASAEGPLPGNGASYLVNMRYSTLALLEDIGLRILSDNEDVRFGDLSFKFHVPTKKAGSFSLWGFGGSSRSLYKSDTTEQEYFNDIWTQKTGAIGLNHTYFAKDNGYFSSRVSLSMSSSVYKYDSLSLIQLGDEKHNEYNLRISTTYNEKLSARNTIRSGLILTHSWFDLYSDYYYREKDMFVRELDQKGSNDLLQGFFQWQHRLNERIKFNLGLHTMIMTLNSDFALEPRVGAEWQFAKDQSFTAGIGVHSRAESPAVYQAQTKSEDGDILFPNEGLGLTRASHFVLGYKNRLTQNLAFKTEIYYQNLFNVPIRPESASAPFDQTFSSINAYGGFTTETLVNNGTGTNYGVELTLERYFSGSYYFLTTASLYESRYIPADGNSYNSRFNGNFIYNFTGGKEFRIGRGRNNVFALNTRLIWAGGNRVTPIDVDQSNIKGRAVYLWNRRFEERLGDYFRIDLGLSYRKNKENYSSVVALNIQNILARENDYGIYYSVETGTVKTSTQMGMFPNLSYRIEF